MNAPVRVESVGQRVRVRLGGELIVDTQRTCVVHEKGLPPRYYVPLEDVRATLQKGQGEGKCPWKGHWHHLEVSAHGKTVPNGAWSYFETTPVFEPIRDFCLLLPGEAGSLRARLSHGCAPSVVPTTTVAVGTALSS